MNEWKISVIVQTEHEVTFRGKESKDNLKTRGHIEDKSEIKDFLLSLKLQDSISWIEKRKTRSGSDLEEHDRKSVEFLRSAGRWLTANS